MTTNLALIETEHLKKCAGCKEPKSLSAFGRNAANDNAGACDGLNIRCRICINQKITEHRQTLREYKASRQGPKMPAPPKQIDMNFSPRRIARMLRKLTPTDRVREAIKCGARTQKEIARVTRLNKDEVTDCIAELLLWQKTIRTQIVNHTRMYFAVEMPNRKPNKLADHSADAVGVLIPARKMIA